MNLLFSTDRMTKSCTFFGSLAKAILIHYFLGTFTPHGFNFRMKCHEIGAIFFSSRATGVFKVV